jgi:flagellar motor switch protein FliM
LDQPANDIITLDVNGKSKFKSKIGLKRYRKTVKIVEIIRTEHDEVKDMLERLENNRASKLAQFKREAEDDE